MTDGDSFLLIAGLGVATYLTRIGGHLVLSRFERLNPRFEAALDAVPAAVMTAIVAPIALTAGIAETVAAAVTVAAALRTSMVVTMGVGAAAAALLRAAGL